MRGQVREKNSVGDKESEENCKFALWPLIEQLNIDKFEVFAYRNSYIAKLFPEKGK